MFSIFSPWDGGVDPFQPLILCIACAGIIQEKVSIHKN